MMNVLMNAEYAVNAVIYTNIHIYNRDDTKYDNGKWTINRYRVNRMNECNI